MLPGSSDQARSHSPFADSEWAELQHLKAATGERPILAGSSPSMLAFRRPLATPGSMTSQEPGSRSTSNPILLPAATGTWGTMSSAVNGNPSGPTPRK